MPQSKRKKHCGLCKAEGHGDIDCRPFHISSHPTREEADRVAMNDRISCLRLTFREGDGLEGK